MDQRTPTSPDLLPAQDDEPTSTPPLPAKDSKKATKERFTYEDIQHLVNWLEHRSNYEKVYGVSGQTAVGKAVKNSMKGYEEMARELTRRTRGKWNLQAKPMKERFQRHRTLYIKTKNLSTSTGFGITDADRKKGIYTIEQKLEDLCHCYARMDKLFGKKPNVVPLVERQQSLVDEDDQLSTTDASFYQDLPEDHNIEPITQGLHGDADAIDTPSDTDALEHEDDLPTASLDHTQSNDDEYDEESRFQETDVPIDAIVATNGSRKRKSTATSRRTRGTDKRKAPPSMNVGPSGSSKSNTLAIAFQDIIAQKNDVFERVEKAKLDWEEKKWEKESRARKTTGRLQVVTMAMEKGMSLVETKEFLRLTEEGLGDGDKDQ
ncbi:hypothetical protein BGX34_003019 [Mortierella sp. NVP85]|nr:hypothetical protein BGX34_003019 [Mortierella sp. NVP85]